MENSDVAFELFNLAGKRADIIRVHVGRGIPVVRSVWREGKRVA